MDPVLAVLEERTLERRHIDRVCALLDTVEAEDVYLAFDILLKLHKYREETQSWSFRLLESHDFESGGNRFELDLAQMVGQRAHQLLANMGQWHVQTLKEKVSRLPQYTDWGMVLTSLVLRIVTVYGAVELALRVAASRATLVRIHCELAQLVGDEAIHQGQPLVDKYRSFVKELLVQLNGSPGAAEQAQMFRTVRDLKNMFTSFKDGQPGPQPRPEETSKPSPAVSPAPSWRRSTDAAASGAGQVDSVSSSGVLSSGVLRAFDTARTEEKIAQVMRPGHRIVGERPLTERTPPLPEASPVSPAAQAPSKPGNAVNVQMVDGRVMVVQESGLVDMQDWLDKANSLKIAPMPTGPRVTPLVPNIASSGLMQALRRGW